MIYESILLLYTDCTVTIMDVSFLIFCLKCVYILHFPNTPFAKQSAKSEKPLFLMGENETNYISNHEHNSNNTIPNLLSGYCFMYTMWKVVDNETLLDAGASL